MDQSDIRMGWAPALLCIEDEPAKTPKVVALKPHPKQKEFDAFAKGNHIGGYVAGYDVYSVGFDFADRPLSAYVFKFGKADKNDLLTLQHVYSEMERALVGHMRSGTGIFRGANDNKTATEVQLRAASAKLRIQDALVNKARVQEKMQRHVEYATMPRRNGKTFTQRMLEQNPVSNDGWFDGAPPDIGWWQASKSKREDHARYWNGHMWTTAVSMLPNSKLPTTISPIEAYARSAKVKWRPVTPHWGSVFELVLDNGRPVLYRPSHEDPLAQLRLHESFDSSSIGGYLGALTKQKVFRAQKRVEAMMHSDPQGGVIGAALGSTPAPELAEVNAALSRLSGAAQGSSCAAQQASSAEAGVDWGITTLMGGGSPNAPFPGGLIKLYKPHVDDTFGEIPPRKVWQPK